MTFATLALLVAVALAGPLLASVPRIGPPLVVGEILAGVAFGHSGLNWIPVANSSLTLLSNIGFALLMLIVGTHLPLRQPALKPALGKAFGITIFVGMLATAGAYALATSTGFANPAILTVLLTTSSAAVALPVIQAIEPSKDKTRTRALLVATTWIAVADVATVLTIPLVIHQGNLAGVLLGIALIAAIATGAYFLLRKVGNLETVHELRHRSKRSHWALDLRVSLLALFSLSAIATAQKTSILIAGFAAGVVLALLGQPRRLAQQLIGLGEGFLIPLFFVTLGAKLDLSALVTSQQNLLLVAVLALGATAIHVVAALVFKLPIGSGLLATASLGVPSAIANLGLQTGQLTSGQAAAILCAVLISLIACSVGANLLGSKAPVGDHAAPVENNRELDRKRLKNG